MNTCQVLSEPEAQLLLKDNPDLVLAVYDYWLSKRLRAVSVCMLYCSVMQLHSLVEIYHVSVRILYSPCFV